MALPIQVFSNLLFEEFLIFAAVIFFVLMAGLLLPLEIILFFMSDS